MKNSCMVLILSGLLAQPVYAECVIRLVAKPGTLGHKVLDRLEKQLVKRRLSVVRAEVFGLNPDENFEVRAEQETHEDGKFVQLLLVDGNYETVAESDAVASERITRQLQARYQVQHGERRPLGWYWERFKWSLPSLSTNERVNPAEIKAFAKVIVAACSKPGAQ